MKTTRRIMILAALLLVAVATQSFAQGLLGLLAPKSPILLGTTGACKNAFPGGPCTQTSTLVQIDPLTGALIKTIGPVGFTVNGLAYDGIFGKLYASTAIGDVRFHGLITIDTKTGAGTPVNPAAPNFGLAGDPSPIHGITIDILGRMVGWYDEFPPPIGITDTFVQINKRTGVATEFKNTGIDTGNNGLAFSNFNILYNIDTTRTQPDGTITQTAYIINPRDGKPFCFKFLSPPTPAALGDFNPDNDLYYGLNFDPTQPGAFKTSIVVVDLRAGTVTPLGPTVPDLHVITFVKTIKFF
ncbi:MAG: hypothetical protein LAO31_17615 [Acidobacteriia bacterium]|nr:hypothetical protein [Terriglobia bacterium]